MTSKTASFVSIGKDIEMVFTCVGSTTAVRVIHRAAASAAWLIVALVLPSGASASPIVIDFESVSPRSTSLGSDFWANNPGFSIGDTTFSGGDFFGFVVSSSTITGTGGYFYGQQFGAASAAAEISAESNSGSGGGFSGGQFAVVSDAVTFGFGPSVINLPVGYRPASVYATNAATTAWLLANPDPNGFASPLSQNGQEFSVTFRGWSQPDGKGTQLGSVKFVLGSYSSGIASIVDDWTSIDLTSLGEATSIDLMFASYDQGDYGINTPTYMAIDNLTLAAVPEPSSIVLLACGGAVVFAAKRWRFRRAHSAASSRV